MFFSVLWMKYMLPKACGESEQHLVNKQLEYVGYVKPKHLKRAKV